MTIKQAYLLVSEVRHLNALTPDERTELAPKAANKRWENARAKKSPASEKKPSPKK